MLQPATKDPRFQGTTTSMNKTMCSVTYKNLDSRKSHYSLLFLEYGLLDCQLYVHRARYVDIIVYACCILLCMACSYSTDKLIWVCILVIMYHCAMCDMFFGGAVDNIFTSIFFKWSLVFDV
jgi:hypothetical protein